MKGGSQKENKRPVDGKLIMLNYKQLKSKEKKTKKQNQHIIHAKPERKVSGAFRDLNLLFGL